TQTPGLQGPQGQDIVVHAGHIIRLRPTSGPSQIETIDITNGSYTISTAGTIPAVLGDAQAMWLSGDNRLFVSKNGDVEEILGWQTNSPSAVPRSTAAQTSAGDGASCGLAKSPFITATNDDYTGTPVTADKGGPVGNIWSNDNLNPTTHPNSSTVTTTVTDNGGLTGVTIGTDGSITVPSGGTPGTYRVTYQICSVVSPADCATAVASVTVVAGAAAAVTGGTSETLAASGVDVAWWADGGAIAFLVGGALLVLVGYRLRTRPRRR
ncbi:MAG TPA: hypothetical protein VN759_12145, partial [Pseudolysinimonas sp.]|nr:hypothetical protein [Pseudolysinimonas sp.]